MGFITKCFIRKNNLELLKKLAEMGYDICPCVDFETSAWLDNCIKTSSIHGIPDHAIGTMLYETDAIDCGDNENLFLALAAMRDDTLDKHIFVNDLGDWAIYHEELTEVGNISGFEFQGIPRCFDPELYRKATAEEIIKIFTNE